MKFLMKLFTWWDGATIGAMSVGAPDPTHLPNNPAVLGNFSAKAGLYWPEISLEHATGGAWSTVYTLTPSAINASTKSCLDNPPKAVSS